jgi:hypothetical protein
VRAGIQGRVEARQAQRHAHREHQAGREAESAQRFERPEIEDKGRRHAEAQEVGQAVEFRAEARCGFQQARQPAIEPVDAGRDRDRDRGRPKTALQGEAHRRQPGAQPQHGQNIGDHAVE